MHRASLAHNVPECTGIWKAHANGTHLVWRCSRCEEIAYGWPEVSVAAVSENLAGYRLRKLADEGQRLLSGL